MIHMSVTDKTTSHVESLLYTKFLVWIFLLGIENLVEQRVYWYWDPSNSIGLSGNYSLEQYHEYRNSIQIK